MAAYKIKKVNQEMAGTVVESASDATDYTPHPPSRSVAKPLCDTRSEIECALADLGIVRKTDVVEIVENGLA